MVTGESTKETVKTIARGMPGDFRRDRGDYARVLCFILHARLRARGRPAFPAPSDFRERTFRQPRAEQAARSRRRVGKRDVMPGLDPGIHRSLQGRFSKQMDCRVKPGNDELSYAVAV
jgi:hypothetical protein